MPARKKIDPDEVRKLAMIGATIQTIADHFKCSRDTIERRFRAEIEEGRSHGRIRALGRVYQKGVVEGQMRALELYLINQCGWTLRPETIVNVTENVRMPVDTRTPPSRSKPTWSSCSGRFWKKLGSNCHLRTQNELVAIGMAACVEDGALTRCRCSSESLIWMMSTLR
jgi:hypothetical protein